MPVDLSTLSNEDRQDFEKRLKVFGLDASHVQEPLSVGGNAQVVLAHGPGRESARRPFVLETTDFAAVKRMVGIDDRVFERGGSRVPLPGRIDLGSHVPSLGRAGVMRDAERSQPQFSAAPGAPARSDDAGAAQLDLRALDSEGIANVRLAARAYVRGNSQLVASYRPILEQAIGKITIPIFALQNIKVASGAVLEFGPGINVVVAHEIEIENGGLIRSRGHLTVTCTRLVRPGRRFVGGLVATQIMTGAFRPIFSEQ